MLHPLRRFFAVGVVSALLALPAVAQAQNGTITGRVASEGRRPIVGAQVLLVGVNRTTITDREGRYTLRDVPPGRVVLRVTAIGHEARQATLTVAAGETVTQDFVLPEQQLSLDELVVTASGEQRRRELGHAIGSIDAASAVETAQPTTFANLLQGRSAGVQILNTSGTTGGNTRIRIRGSSSVSLSNEPLLVVDGIRVENGQNSFSIGTGGQSISRINDFNPEDIESIEIIKGPAAATLYGTAAANGLIRIKTKRGSVGAPRWNAYVEQGASDLASEWVTNFQAVTSTGGTCKLPNQSAGTCTIATVLQANPLEGDAGTSGAANAGAPFKTAHREQYGVNVSGGTDAVQYFISGEWESEDGVAHVPEYAISDIEAAFGEVPANVNRPNALQRLSLRANARAQVLPNADVSVQVGIVSSDIRLPESDNNVTGYIPSGLLGRADGINDNWGFFRPEDIFFVENSQSVDRVTGSFSGNWTPFPWLSTRATLGYDLVARQDVGMQANGTGPNFSIGRDGVRSSDKTDIHNYTIDWGATGTFDVTDRISSKTSVGVQYNREIFRQVSTDGEILPPGAGSNASATNQFIGEAFVESITLGTYVEQQFGINDRIFVTGAVRADDNSAFGEDFSLEVYPKVSASWLLSEESWFPETGFLDNFRIRGAWGESGLQPGSNDALKFYSGVAFVDDGSESSGVVISGAGNDLLEPERSSELELGMDANLLNGRVGVEFTYFNKKTTNALISRPLPPSLGSTASRFDNIGETKNWGFEGVLNAVILESENLGWDLTLSGSTFKNELTDLAGLPDIIFGDQRHVEGFPLGGAWDFPVNGFSDANNDGIITQDELNVGSEEVFLGYAQPRHEGSLTNTFTFFNRFRLTGLLDYRGGHRKLNLTERFRCAISARVCEGLNSLNAPLDLQAQAVQVQHPRNTYDLFWEPGWFVKLRELSLTFFAPDEWAQALRVDRLTFTVAGRNLITWDDYLGTDVEVNQTAASNFTDRDFLTQPQVRYLTARLGIQF